ncbi:hypothetical protein IGI04_006222 [Brassica rapa subsp. trilocularis]|uniref:Leucine-rich repeat-containing N-terminal plant-type domain-containing protein n=1 Tax=Brassica rapa subsp. trilocularis TaxID=1813537 RepID=A0ABQ7NGQ1_BRACM|nr:hypothetical protein IGI04_006222 [Brassica rapa subsp. trilocularis]
MFNLIAAGIAYGPVGISSLRTIKTGSSKLKFGQRKLTSLQVRRFPTVKMKKQLQNTMETKKLSCRRRPQTHIVYLNFRRLGSCFSSEEELQFLHERSRNSEDEAEYSTSKGLAVSGRGDFGILDKKIDSLRYLSLENTYLNFSASESYIFSKAVLVEKIPRSMSKLANLHVLDLSNNNYNTNINIIMMTGSHCYCFFGIISIFFSLIIHTLSSTTPHSCLHHQREALLEFRDEFPIDEFDPNPWNKSSTDCCLWKGITCDDRSGQVISLNLVGTFLNGSFKTNSSLFRLQYLRHLNLSYCDIQGEIPSSLGNFSRLTLIDLSHNNLVAAKTVELGANTLIGAIPSSLGKLNQLRYLSLAANELTGEIPSSLGNLSSLLELRAPSLRVHGGGIHHCSAGPTCRGGPRLV